MKRGGIVALVVAGLVVVGIGGAVALSLTGGADAMPETAQTVATPTPTQPAPEPSESESEPDPEPAETSEPAPQVTAGQYTPYSEAALAAAEGTRVLFFHAPWCPQCVALDADIRATGVPDGITILQVDYDSNQQLRQRYGVTLQTTVVALDADGNGTGLFVPYAEPTLATALDGLNLAG